MNKLLLLIIVLLPFSIYGIQSSNSKVNIRKHIKFLAYEDTSGRGNFAWTGSWYVGEISVFTSGAKNHHLIASWNMVEIFEESINKDIGFSPWILSNFDTVGEHLENININSEYFTFDIVNDTEGGKEIVHITYDIKSNTFTGSGILWSKISKNTGLKKYEYRSIDKLTLPTKEVY